MRLRIFPWVLDVCLPLEKCLFKSLAHFKTELFLLLLRYNESLIFDLFKIESVEKCLFFQDKVLHNIMSIFTFMGANVMRLDDTYSFQVINKTVKMVIPALIQVSRLYTIASVIFYSFTSLSKMLRY